MSEIMQPGQATLVDFAGPKQPCGCCGEETAHLPGDYCAGCTHRGCHIDEPMIDRDCWSEL